MEACIRNMLNTNVWAVVGATNKKDKFGFKIFKVMKEAGLAVYPVNPGVNEVLGEKCYAALRDLAILPEAVDIAVPAKVGMNIIRECADLGIKKVWFQPGAESEEVIQLAEKLGLEVVHHACIMKELTKKRVLVKK